MEERSVVHKVSASCSPFSGEAYFRPSRQTPNGGRTWAYVNFRRSLPLCAPSLYISPFILGIVPSQYCTHISMIYSIVRTSATSSFIAVGLVASKKARILFVCFRFRVEEEEATLGFRLLLSFISFLFPILRLAA